MTKLIWQKIGCVTGKAPIAFSPDNNILIGRSIDPDLRAFKFWDISQAIKFVRSQFLNTSSSFEYCVDSCLASLAISSDAQKIAIYNGYTIELWNLNNGQILDHLFITYDSLEMPSIGINFISNEELIFWDNYWFWTWKFIPNRFICHLEIDRFPALCHILNCFYNERLFLVINQKLLIISTTESNNSDSVRNCFWEAKSLGFQVVREIKIDGITPTCLTISQTGSFLLVGYSDWIIRLYDANTGELIRCFSKHSSSVKSVAISPDCRSIASVEESVDSDTSIKVWNTVTGELNANLTGSSGAVTSLLFSPDSTKLATSGDIQVTLFALNPELPKPTYSINDDFF